MAKHITAESTRSTEPPDNFSSEELAALFTQTSSFSKLSEDRLTILGLRGALFTLFNDGSPAAVKGILLAARSCPIESIRVLAVTTLGEMAAKLNDSACDALYDLSVFDDHSLAVQIIIEKRYSTTRQDIKSVFLFLHEKFAEYRQADPNLEGLTHFMLTEANPDMRQRLIQAGRKAGLRSWVTIIEAGTTPTIDTLGALHRQFSSFQENERQLALDLLARIDQKEILMVRDAICQLFVDFDYLPARSLALSSGYAPSTPIQAALFYFLAEQWQMYEYLDFNQSLLAAAYDAAGDHLRKRILSLSRYSGRTEWMAGLSTTSRQRWLWDMNDADWELALRNLTVGRQYADLWRLAQVAPPVWCAKIIAVIHESEWQPDQNEAKEGFLSLLEKSLPIKGSLPPISLVQTWPSPSQDISCLALSTDGSFLAVGGSNSTIHLWGIYNAPSPLPPVIGPVSTTRSLAFSPDGEYLAVANGDNTIRAYRRSDGTFVKAFEGHTGFVKSLVFSGDSRTLFSASFDTTLRAWRFPHGAEIQKIEPGKNELFGLGVSPDGQILLAAGSDQLVRVYRWADGELLWQLPGHTTTITSLATVARGQLAATAGRDGSIFLWNYVAGRAINHLEGTEMITAIAFHPGEQFILSGTAQGNIAIWNCITGEKMEQIQAHRQAINGLAVSPDGKHIYSSSTDGTISSWDLQLFTWAFSPIGTNRSQTLALAEQRAKQSSSRPNERYWLLFLIEMIRWRQRFDIELSDMHPTISIGEFDIEL